MGKYTISSYWLFAFMFLLSCNQEGERSSAGKKNKTIDSGINLVAKKSADTGISFNNKVEGNSRLNNFVWNFIYQGAGVAIGDINNDGLPDIYFCGNMVSDKLYLNKGNFKFEDISKDAGIIDRNWSTGVTMADVNADGLLDIYVCKNFFLLQEQVRSNKLFINQGNNKFKELAKSYGIADPGYSIQSSFFDADNDGDLDLYLVNQPMDENAAKMARAETLKSLPYSDQLYINENGKFESKTNSVDLKNKRYGLAAQIGDFDKNGWTDIYLCNDYDHGDNLLMNKGELVFEDELKKRVDHTSFYSMGADAADINNDGWLDLITLDMAFSSHYRSKTNMESMRPQRFWDLVEAGHHYQYAVNNLQLNNGGGYFSEIAQLAGVSKTDWSWSPLFADLDDDGNQDLLISNGLVKDLRNNDFLNYVRDTVKQNINEQNYHLVAQKIPSTPVSNIVFQNNGNLNFENVSKNAGFDYKGFSSGMAYGDLDGDGDLDIVINNSNAEASVFENKSNSNSNNNYINVVLEGKAKNTNGLGANVTIYYEDQIQSGIMNSSRGYMSASQAILHFGLGNTNTIDSVVVDWDHISHTTIENVKSNQTLKINYSKTIKKANKLSQAIIKTPHKIVEYKHSDKFYDDYADQVLLPHKLSQNGPFISTADVNGDGKSDFFIAGGAGQASSIQLQLADGKFKSTNQGLLNSLDESEHLESVFFDLENDGDQDLYIVSGGGEKNKAKNKTDHLLINDGNGNFKKSTANLDFTNIDGQCVLAFDFENDGDQDIFIGGRMIPGKYPAAAASKLLINENGSLVDKTDLIAPDLKSLGMVTDAIADDYDNDNDTDLIVVGEWMPITILKNDENKLNKASINIGNEATNGWWWSISQGDFDNDGDRDYIIGNLGLNNKFNPSKEKPFKVFSGDLDNNGDHDIVLAKTIDKKLYPVRGKECSTEEMPYISEKFEKFHDFASASLFEIIPEDKLKSSTNYSIESFASVYIENQGNGNFKKHVLPIQAQMGPIKSIKVTDINNDGNLDFYFGGNHYPVEVETVRYDGNKGGLFLGQGNGGFTFVPASKSGVYLDGDIRDLELIKINGETYLQSCGSNEPIKFYKL